MSASTRRTCHSVSRKKTPATSLASAPSSSSGSGYSISAFRSDIRPCATRLSIRFL